MNSLLASDLGQFSRREFLKYLQYGALALFWIPLQEKAIGAERLVTDTGFTLGRVLLNYLEVHDKPSYDGKVVKTYKFDQVLTINAATVGDEKPAYNRVWYLVENEGYVHSGRIQPVAMNDNHTLLYVPEGGRLAEVSVPFTDAVLNPERPERAEYRFYYGTTHWIQAIVRDKKNTAWYSVWDDKYKVNYYVNPSHLRPIEPAEFAPLSPEILPDGKRIEVRLKDQVVICYEGDRAVYMTRTASGVRNYFTPYGSFITSRKRPSRHMTGGELATAEHYDLPGVPWVCYLNERGVSFHGTYWHNDYGRPRSHGCLNLTPSAAQWIYRWTLPQVAMDQQYINEENGTRVDIID